MARSILPLCVLCLLIAGGCQPAKPIAPATASPSAPQPVVPAPQQQATSQEPQTPAPQAETALPPTLPQKTQPTTADALPELAAQLLAPDGRGGWKINPQAATELDELGPEGASQLWSLLQNEQLEVRRGAAYYLLGKLDPTQPVQTGAFIARLDDPDPTVRGFALSAVGQMRRADQIAALPRLLPMLTASREARADKRMIVARLIGSLKSDGLPALAELATSAAQDREAGVRGACLAAIKEIAAPAEAAAPLGAGLADKEASVRLVAVLRLSQLGPAAAPAASQLAAAVGDSDERIRDAAVLTLVAIGKPAVEPLVAQLSSENVMARKYALAGLAKLGPAAAAALPAIEKCRQDADPAVRKLAEAATKRISSK